MMGVKPNHIGLSLGAVVMFALPGCERAARSEPPSDPRVAFIRGFSNVVVSQMEVQECPTVFQIKPELKAEHDALLRRVYPEGSAKRLASAQRTEQECLDRAREYFAGPQTVRYLALTPAAKKRLQ